MSRNAKQGAGRSTSTGAPPEWQRAFATDSKQGVLYIDDRLGLHNSGRVHTVARARLGPVYTTKRVRASVLRRVLRGIALQSKQQTQQSINVVHSAQKPTPPVGSQRRQQKTKHPVAQGAPLSDWWPGS